MQTLRGWFGPADEPSSVLDEWNKYNAERAGPSSSDTLLSSMEQGSTNVQNFFSKGVNQVGSGVQGLGGSLQSNLPSVQMPNMQQFAYFFAFLLAGFVFLIIAFSLFLPVIILAPNKFAISFTIASGFIMAALTALKGWRQQLHHMMTQERLPFTAAIAAALHQKAIQSDPMKEHCHSSCSITHRLLVKLLYEILTRGSVKASTETMRPGSRFAQSLPVLAAWIPAVYMGSMGGTLYAAMYMHSYIMSLLFCGIQVLALVYYVASYFPGGSAGVKFVMSLMYRAIANCMAGVQKMISG